MNVGVLLPSKTFPIRIVLMIYNSEIQKCRMYNIVSIVPSNLYAILKLILDWSLIEF